MGLRISTNLAAMSAQRALANTSVEQDKSELQFQVGIRKEKDDADRILFQPNDYNVRASNLGIDGVNYESIDDARESMERVDGAIDKVFEARARLGATQNELHATVNNL